MNTAEIGDNLLRQGSYVEHDGVRLLKEVGVGALQPYRLRAGWYLKVGENRSSGFFLPSSQEGGAIIKSALADPPQVVQVPKGKGSICVVTVFNASVCAEAQFERGKQPVLSSDSFQQTLIYNGLVGEKLNIGYREFSNSLARPAFHNDVEYDLSKSRTIGYRGARLEILNASNESITYKVLENFNRADR